MSPRSKSAGNASALSSIAPGDFAKVTFEPKTDSALRMCFRLADGDTRDCVGDVYASNGMQSEIVVTIEAVGRCRVEDVILQAR